MFCFLKLSNSVHLKQVTGNRCLWQWLNIVFNSVDDERRKLLGPDRTCAEWLLRNGASVKWTTADKFLADYNELPKEDVKFHIKEVDASDSSISDYGFSHFKGCQHIEKIVLHNCLYLEDGALPQLLPVKPTLKFLQVSGNGNITGKGVLSLGALNNLQALVMFKLPAVSDGDDVLKKLSQDLPNCNISLK